MKPGHAAQVLAAAFAEMDSAGSGMVSSVAFERWMPNGTMAERMVSQLTSVKPRPSPAMSPPTATVHRTESIEYLPEDLIDELTHEEAVEACQEVGMQPTDAVGLQTMKIALKTHYGGKKRTVREAFDDMDSDGSGTLDKQEVEMAFAAMGRLMTTEELTATFAERDRDGDGRLTFEEFKAWSNNEPVVTLIDADATEPSAALRAQTEEAAEACREAGLAVTGTESLQSMQIALKSRQRKTRRTAREAFDEVDRDRLGTLDKKGVELAFASMGRLMSAEVRPPIAIENV